MAISTHVYRRAVVQSEDGTRTVHLTFDLRTDEVKAETYRYERSTCPTCHHAANEVVGAGWKGRLRKVRSRWFLVPASDESRWPGEVKYATRKAAFAEVMSLAVANLDAIPER